MISTFGDSLISCAGSEVEAVSENERNSIANIKTKAIKI